MKHLCLLAALLLVCPAHAGETFSLAASGGEFNAIEGPVLGARGKVTATVKVSEMKPSPCWAPAVVVGFSGGAPRNHNNSIQFVLFQNLSSDDFMTFGYRLVEGGVITEQKYLAHGFRMGAPVKVAVSFDAGAFTYTADDQLPVTIRTKLGKVRNYFSVNSGSAEISDVTILDATELQ